MEAARLYELRGMSGGALVLLRGVPCFVCPDDAHPRRMSTNDFPAKLNEAVLAAGSYPVTRPRRFGREACSGCGKRLKNPVVRQGEVSEEVQIDGAAMTIEISASVTECRHCGCTQIRATPRLSAQIQQAMAAALAKAGLRP